MPWYTTWRSVVRDDEDRMKPNIQVSGTTAKEIMEELGDNKENQHIFLWYLRKQIDQEKNNRASKLLFIDLAFAVYQGYNVEPGRGHFATYARNAALTFKDRMKARAVPQKRRRSPSSSSYSTDTSSIHDEIVVASTRRAPQEAMHSGSRDEEMSLFCWTWDKMLGTEDARFPELYTSKDPETCIAIGDWWMSIDEKVMQRLRTAWQQGQE